MIDISQGIYYGDTWSFSEYGEISLNALDGAKILAGDYCPKDYV
jgi:hypothetical protein